MKTSGRPTWLAPLCALAGALVSCGGGDTCSAGGLTAALAAAMSGTTVEVGACRVMGRFVVPAGVTLHGLGPAMSTLANTGTVLQLEPGATVDGLSIENGAGHGIVAVDGGAITLRNVEVRSTRARAAIGISAAATVSMTNVTVTGPVTPANAIDVPDPATEADTALFGIVLQTVGSATLDHVTVGGFGAAGVVATNSLVTWTDGAVNGNLGMGIWIDGGHATLTRLTVDHTLRGFRGVPSYGLASGNGARLETTSLTVSNTDGGFGLMHDGGNVTHMGLSASGHAAGAIVAQRTASFSISGASVLHDNMFAGLIAVEAAGLDVGDVTVRGTRLAARYMSAWGMVNVGDGVQIVRPMPGTMVHGLTTMDNDRAGLLLDLGGATTASFSIAAASVDASGTAFGCVMQNGAAVAGWDAHVTRAGVALTNDAMFHGGQDVVGIISPTDLPAASSLAGIISPTD